MFKPTKKVAERICSMLMALITIIGFFPTEVLYASASDTDLQQGQSSIGQSGEFGNLLLEIEREGVRESYLEELKIKITAEDGFEFDEEGDGVYQNDGTFAINVPEDEDYEAFRLYVMNIDDKYSIKESGWESPGENGEFYKVFARNEFASGKVSITLRRADGGNDEEEDPFDAVVSFVINAESIDLAEAIDYTGFKATLTNDGAEVTSAEADTNGQATLAVPEKTQDESLGLDFVLPEGFEFADSDVNGKNFTRAELKAGITVEVNAAAKKEEKQAFEVKLQAEKANSEEKEISLKDIGVDVVNAANGVPVSNGKTDENGAYVFEVPAEGEHFLVKLDLPAGVILAQGFKSTYTRAELEEMKDGLPVVVKAAELFEINVQVSVEKIEDENATPAQNIFNFFKRSIDFWNNDKTDIVGLSVELRNADGSKIQDADQHTVTIEGTTGADGKVTLTGDLSLIDPTKDYRVYISGYKSDYVVRDADGTQWIMAGSSFYKTIKGDTISKNITLDVALAKLDAGIAINYAFNVHINSIPQNDVKVELKTLNGAEAISGNVLLTGSGGFSAGQVQWNAIPRNQKYHITVTSPKESVVLAPSSKQFTYLTLIKSEKNGDVWEYTYELDLTGVAQNYTGRSNTVNFLDNGAQITVDKGFAESLKDEDKTKTIWIGVLSYTDMAAKNLSNIVWKKLENGKAVFDVGRYGGSIDADGALTVAKAEEYYLFEYAPSYMQPIGNGWPETPAKPIYNYPTGGPISGYTMYERNKFSISKYDMEIKFDNGKRDLTFDINPTQDIKVDVSPNVYKGKKWDWDVLKTADPTSVDLTGAGKKGSDYDIAYTVKFNRKENPTDIQGSTIYFNDIYLNLAYDQLAAIGGNYIEGKFTLYRGGQAVDSFIVTKSLLEQYSFIDADSELCIKYLYSNTLKDAQYANGQSYKVEFVGNYHYNYEGNPTDDPDDKNTMILPIIVSTALQVPDAIIHDDGDEAAPRDDRLKDFEDTIEFPANLAETIEPTKIIVKVNGEEVNATITPGNGTIKIKIPGLLAYEGDTEIIVTYTFKFKDKSYTVPCSTKYDIDNTAFARGAETGDKTAEGKTKVPVTTAADAFFTVSKYLVNADKTTTAEANIKFQLWSKDGQTKLGTATSGNGNAIIMKGNEFNTVTWADIKTAEDYYKIALLPAENKEYELRLYDSDNTDMYPPYKDKGAVNKWERNETGKYWFITVSPKARTEEPYKGSFCGPNNIDTYNVPGTEIEIEKTGEAFATAEFYVIGGGKTYKLTATNEANKTIHKIAGLAHGDYTLYELTTVTAKPKDANGYTWEKVNSPYPAGITVGAGKALYKATPAITLGKGNESVKIAKENLKKDEFKITKIMDGKTHTGGNVTFKFNVYDGATKLKFTKSGNGYTYATSGGSDIVEITVGSGEAKSVSVLGLPADKTYTVKEIKPDQVNGVDAYDITKAGDKTIRIEWAGDEKEASFTNKLVADASIKVTKTVIGGDTGDKFEFQIFEEDGKTPVNLNNLTVDDNANGGITDRVTGKFWLKNGGSVEFKGLTPGKKYVVKELNATLENGAKTYDVYAVDNNNKQAKDGTIAELTAGLEADNKVEFTNTRGTTGEWEVTKKVNGTWSENDTFNFKLEKSTDYGKTWSAVNFTTESVTVTNANITTAASGLFSVTNDDASKKSKAFKFNGLKNGIMYKVTELGSYTNYTISDDTAILGGGTPDSEITNIRKPGEISLTKVVQGKFIAEEDTFTFKIFKWDGKNTTPKNYTELVVADFANIALKPATGTNWKIIGNSITVSGFSEAADTKTIIVTGLELGMEYKIVEVENPKYTLDEIIQGKFGKDMTGAYVIASEDASKGNGSQAKFRNARRMDGKIRVAKGEMTANYDGEAFEFTIDPTVASGKIVSDINAARNNNDVVTVTDGKFTLYAGETVEFSALPTGIVYKITEILPVNSKYKLVSVSGGVAVAGEENSNTVSAAPTPTTVTFKNARKTDGKLTIKKELENGSTEQNKSFSAKIKIDGTTEYITVSGTAPNYKYTGKDATGTVVSFSVNTLAEISDIPLGMKLKVEEQSTEGYNVEYKNNGNEITNASIITVENKTDPNKTKLSVKKTAVNYGDDSFAIQVTGAFSDAETVKSFIFAKEANLSANPKIYKIGDSIAVPNVIAGNTYKVSETFADGSKIANYDVTAKIGATDTTLNNGEGTVKIEAAKDKTFEFINTRGTNGFKFTKVVTGTWDDGESFEFTISPVTNGLKINNAEVAADGKFTIAKTATSVEITGLLKGQEYTITETQGKSPNYTIDGTGTVTIKGDGSNKEGTITNKRREDGKLKFKKSVIGDYFANDTFEFELQKYNPDTKAFEKVTTIAQTQLSVNPADATVTWDDTTKSIKVSSNESSKDNNFEILINGLEYGQKYKIIETTPVNYTKSGDDAEVVADAEETIKTTITNTRKTDGEILLTKAVSTNVEWNTQEFKFALYENIGGTWTKIANSDKTIKGTDANKTVKWESLTWGKEYRVYEAINGKFVPYSGGQAWDKDATGYYKSVTAGEKVNLGTVTNNLTELKVKKTATNAGTDKFEISVIKSNDDVLWTGTFAETGIEDGSNNASGQEYKFDTVVNVPGVEAGETYTISEKAISGQLSSYKTEITGGTIKTNTDSERSVEKMIDAGTTATITFENTRETDAKLKVSKVVEAKYDNQIFTFTTSIPNGTTGTITNPNTERKGNVNVAVAESKFQLYAGETVEFGGLLRNQNYKVTEVLTGDTYVFDGAVNGDSTTVDKTADPKQANGTAKTADIETVKFMNARNMSGKLMVTKTVDPDDAVYRAEAFEFTISAPLYNDKWQTDDSTLPYYISGAADVAVAPDGTATFKLKHGETALFSNMAIGTTYTVKEKDDKNYYTVTPSASQASKAITAAGETITFTNTRKEGKLSVKKIVANPSSVENNTVFTIAVNGKFFTDDKKSTETTTKYFRFSEDGGNDANGKIYKWNSDVVEVELVIANEIYNISEPDANNANIADYAVKVTSENVTATAESQIVTVTNTRKMMGKISITKLLADSDPTDANSQFKFKVTDFNGKAMTVKTGYVSNGKNNRKNLISDMMGEFVLYAGETVEFRALPANATYYVEEIDTGVNYTLQSNGTNTNAKVDISTEEGKVAFTNKRSMTGQLDVKKFINPEDADYRTKIFKFTISSANHGNDVWQTTDAAAPYYVSFSKNGTYDGDGKFTIGHDETAQFRNLPLSEKYTVTENAQENYKVTYLFDRAGATEISGNVADIVASKETSAITFINTHKNGYGLLKVNKITSGIIEDDEIFVIKVAGKFFDAADKNKVSTAPQYIFFAKNIRAITKKMADTYGVSEFTLTIPYNANSDVSIPRVIYSETYTVTEIDSALNNLASYNVEVSEVDADNKITIGEGQQTVNVTNTRKDATLFIQKNITGDYNTAETIIFTVTGKFIVSGTETTADETRTYAFTSDGKANANTPKDVIEIAKIGDGNILVDGAVYGYQYTITESVTGGEITSYIVTSTDPNDVESSGTERVITAIGNEKPVIFENAITSLIVEKTVTDGDVTSTFGFQVQNAASEAMSFISAGANTYRYSNSANAITTMNIKHTEKITVIGLPMGEYKVVETIADGHVATYTGGEGTDNNGIVVNGKELDKAVKINNTLAKTQLTIEKKIANLKAGQTITDTFTMVVKNSAGKYLTFTGGAYTGTTTTITDAAKIPVKAGAKVTLTGLPYDAKYTVEEPAEFMPKGFALVNIQQPVFTVTGAGTDKVWGGEAVVNNEISDADTALTIIKKVKAGNGAIATGTYQFNITLNGKQIPVKKVTNGYVYDENGTNFIIEIVTGSSAETGFIGTGSTVVTQLPYNAAAYTVSETNLPDGYELDSIENASFTFAQSEYTGVTLTHTTTVINHIKTSSSSSSSTSSTSERDRDRSSSTRDNVPDTDRRSTNLTTIGDDNVPLAELPGGDLTTILDDTVPLAGGFPIEIVGFSGLCIIGLGVLLKLKTKKKDEDDEK